MVSFQPLDAVQKLRDAGVDEPQATATVEVVGDAASDLVTRDYLDGRFDQSEARLDVRFAEQNAEMQGLRADTQVFRAEVDARFEGLRAEMYRANWFLGGGIVAMLSIVFSALVVVAQILD